MVCLSVSLSVMIISPAWTHRDAIWDVDLGGLKEPYITWGPDRPMQWGNWGENGRSRTWLAIDTLKGT